MSRVKWDQTGEKWYETGTDCGVLYPINTSTGAYEKGVPWNGLTGVDENPSGAEANKIYADNDVYLTLMSAEEFGGNIKAYTYPDEFKPCNGEAELATGVNVGQQVRQSFGFSFRSRKGNDISETAAHILHLWYGCKASPSEKSYSTVNDSPEAAELSWEVTTTPVGVNIQGMNLKSTSLITVDSSTADPAKFAQLEAMLWGSDGQEAQPAVYEETADTVYNPSKTYYTKSGDVYTVAEITEFAEGVTYYEQTSPAIPAIPASDPKLPTPEEVYTLFTAS